MSHDDKIAYFGLTDFRNKKTKFGIKNSDRSRHVYIIGKTGMGKSTLLENLAAQDILNGEGMCFVDPHGSAIDALIEYIPEHRVTDVVYFAPFDTQFPISFNVLEDVEPDQRHLVMAGLMASFKKIWPDSFSARMEYILSNVLLALLEYPDATLLGVNRMLAEKDYRDAVIAKVTDSSVKAFWIDEYNKWDPRYAREAGAAIQNKIGQFTSNPLVRNIIGQTKTSFNLREMMDSKKILLVNLSKGRIGETNSNLLGGMLITKLYLAAMSRADVGAQGVKKLPPFFFFVDEFQNFANESFADILSEARKYKLNLTVAHQYVDQMQEEVASAIFGNVGTMITFRIGATDAEIFEKQFAPTFSAEDIVNLGKFQIYLSLMIDGIGSRPFSAGTLPPIPTPEVSMRDHIIANSRYWYAQERHVVEEKIKTWYEPIKKPIKKRINNPADLSKASEKKVFKIQGKKQKETSENQIKQRDFSSPLKKVLKEVDEKEAELEMKKIVSPKLNKLLDSFESQPKKNKVFKKTFNKIKESENYSNESKSIISDSVKDTVANLAVLKKEEKPITQKKENKTRGAQPETKSSLSELLEKALGGNSSKKPAQKKEVQKKNISDESKKNPKEKEKVGNKDVKKTISKKNNSPVNKLKDKSTLKENTRQKKEVPEDVLKDIFK